MLHHARHDWRHGKAPPVEWKDTVRNKRHGPTRGLPVNRVTRGGSPAVVLTLMPGTFSVRRGPRDVDRGRSRTRRASTEARWWSMTRMASVVPAMAERTPR